MDEVFKALADPTRRRMLDSLNTRGGQSLVELCAGLEMARQSVSKHLAVLEAARLVTTRRRGREKLHYLNPAPINDIEQRWINQYDRGRVQALGDLKIALEDKSMGNHEFVYETYIRATPELVWQGLTDPTFTKQYWGLELVTDWKAGSPIAWEQDGVTIADPEQVVLEADPFRRLAYTWHTFTPEWARVNNIDEARRARLAAATRSQVVFEIEPDGDLTKLTVLHEYFEPGSLVGTMVGEGWPRLLSELKSLLETGVVLSG